jgi:hypothetical protein
VHRGNPRLHDEKIKLKVMGESDKEAIGKN